MKSFLAILLLVCVALPAFGKTHVIRVLGTQPLFPGQSESRGQFLELMHRYPQRETIALKALGIDRYAFEQGMRSAQAVVTGGQFHLDAMAFYAGGVKIARDVEIPAHTWMWVVHLPRKTIYVPQACGNISTVATAAVAAYETSFPVPARKAVSTVPQTPAIGAPTPQAALAMPVPLATPVAAPAAHHGKFPWWIFLVPIALLSHGNSGSTGSAPPPILIPPVHSSASPSPRPTASATPCPTPTPKPSPTPCPSGTKSVRH